MKLNTIAISILLLSAGLAGAQSYENNSRSEEVDLVAETCYFWVVNAFSYERNQNFTIDVGDIQSYKISIYNRWGQLLHNKEEKIDYKPNITDQNENLVMRIDIGWDISKKDRNQVVVYLLEVTCKDGAVIKHHGNITIMD